MWRRGLAGASAFDRRDPDVSNLLGEIRLHQLVAEVTTAVDPQEVTERVTEYLQERPPLITLASAASVLVNVGQYAAAIQIYERLRREAPADPEYPRALLLAQEAAGDLAAVEEGLTATPASPLVGRTELLLRRARLADTVGETDRPGRLLLQARQADPGALPILRFLTLILEREKRLDDVAAVWSEASKHDPGLGSLAAMAALEIRRGRKEAAFILARDAPEPSSEAEQTGWFVSRVGIYLSSGHGQEAVELARQRVREGKTAGITQACTTLAQQGQTAAARELLAAAVRSARDPLTRYQLQAALLKEICAAHDGPTEDFVRGMRRLERFAAAVPGQREGYLNDRYSFAMMRGATDWLEGELKREWDNGQGDVAPGDRLADLYIATKQWEPLHQLVAAVDRRPNLPEGTLFSLESRLLRAGHAEWALPVSDRLCRRFPRNTEYAVTRARALWQAGQRDGAARLLERLDAGAVFRDDFSDQAALAYEEFGERSRAVNSLERTTALDPLALRSAPLYCRLSGFYLEDHRFEDAYRLLGIVYRNPAQADMNPLVDYLAAAGRLRVDAAGEVPGGELPLTFLRRAQLLAAVHDRLTRTERGDEAFRLAGAHPELLSAVPKLVVALRQNATSEQVPALTKLLEEASRQAGHPSELLRSELAKLYVRRAELATASQPPQPGEALNFLTQAYELAPDDFNVARPLAVAFRAQGQVARAEKVLAPFLEAGTLPTEQAAARLVLAPK